VFNISSLNLGSFLGGQSETHKCAHSARRFSQFGGTRLVDSLIRPVCFFLRGWFDHNLK
jgi:hypothetical protein